MAKRTTHDDDAPRWPAGRFAPYALGAILLIAALVVAVAASLLALRARTAALAAWEARLDTLIGARVEVLGTWWRERLGDARVIGRTLALEHEAAELEQWLDTVRTAYDFEALYVTAPDGIRWRSGLVPDTLDGAVLRLSAAARASGRPEMRVSGTGPADALFLMGVPLDALPVESGGQVVTFVIDPGRSLYPLLAREAPLGMATAEVVIARAEADSVVLLSPLRHAAAGARFVRLPRSDTTIAAVAAVSGRRRAANVRDYRGEPVIMASRADGRTGWTLIWKVDRSEALGEARRATRFYAAAAVLLVALIGAWGHIWWQQAVRLDIERRRAVRASAMDRARLLEVEDRAARLARIVDRAPLQVLVCDARTLRVTLANRRALDAFGVRFEQAAQRTLPDLVPPQDAPAFEQALDRLRRDPSGTYIYRTELEHRDGARAPVEVRLDHLGTETPPVFVAVIQDLSERARLEEQLRAAQRLEAVGRLAGGVAHDFNNLLTVIQGAAELALDPAADAGRMRTELDEIRRAARRATALTGQLLAFGRRQILQPRPLDLSEVVRGMSAILRRLVPESIEIDVRPRAQRVISADVAQLEQVLLNLVLNARDAMPDGGRLTIETADVLLDDGHADVPPGPYVVLAVRDTGIGMDVTTLARVFEPFYTTKEQGKGTGLGLASVYGIVRQSGGHIRVDSEPGRGSTFEVYLPAVVSAGGAVSLPPHADDAPAVLTGSESVLLVEDDPAVRAYTARVLARGGYTVVEASGGEQALELAADRRIDLVITDLVMPGMSGRVLADRLRSGRPELRVLFMSGFTAEAIAADGILDGDARFLPKPFPPAALLRAVRRLIDAEGSAG
jgi:two-component system cell cycle sensor histidine kinase/response regulator CckA